VVTKPSKRAVEAPSLWRFTRGAVISAVLMSNQLVESGTLINGISAVNPQQPTL
jgi:hypothetical protein